MAKTKAARSTAARTDVMTIGTRRSALALKQARLVQEALAERGITSELVTFTTVGDKHQDEPLNGIGAKGLFTHELELALAKGKISCAVHSLKDLPTESPDGITVVAVLPREDPRDVLVLNRSAGAIGLADLPRGSRVGTSSLRRRAQLLAIRSDVDVVELRGNVPTRLRKIDDGQVHAAILAAAGLHRLDARQHIAAYLEPPAWLPAAGQGAIAIQARSDDVAMCTMLKTLNHEPTMRAVRAERAFLAALESGCQVPIGTLLIEGKTDAASATLHGFIADVAGRRVLRSSRVLNGTPEECGRALASDLRDRGAEKILAELRDAERVVAPQPE